MRDYAKKDFSIPKRKKQDTVLDFLACCVVGAMLGGLFGYGLLFT